MYDVIIIGAGPAGITAGLYTARGNLKTMIIYKGKSSLEKAKKIENYYGFKEGILGEDLYKNGIEQAKKIGIEMEEEEVLEIIQEEEKIFLISFSFLSLDTSEKSSTFLKSLRFSTE